VVKAVARAVIRFVPADEAAQLRRGLGAISLRCGDPRKHSTFNLNGLEEQFIIHELVLEASIDNLQQQRG
jgi:hypothetical protein